MERTLHFTISEADCGCTVGAFLARRGFSRAVRTALKKTERGIVKNGEWCYTNDTLDCGDVLTLTIAEKQSSEQILPVRLPFGLLYEDEDLLVVEKPADMPTHPSLHNYDNTLANALAYYYKEKKEPFIFRCINRLDRQTTGITLIAKNAFSGCLLYRDAAAHKIRRSYLAIAAGEFTEGGTIDAPIAREDGSAITRCVSFTDGAPAVTHYEPLYTKNGYTLVRLRLETGRTHQIRVHMKYLGYPLIGDYLYNPDFSRIRRVALHSASLTFRHPITGRKLTFDSPLPQDMEDVLR